MLTPAASAYRGRAFVAWSDPRSNGLTIYGATTVYLPTDVVDDPDVTVPSTVELYQNYPNPFNPTTTISFALPGGSEVELSVYNLLGQKVRTLTDRYYSAGTYELTWDGQDSRGQTVASGVYFYRLRAGEIVQQKKMLLLK
ncbi:T9SS type A sorting domain-containing protein [candidate division GN15 bacterium]|nr:T9SS type A sorting domain-containing protein [candidate division GN15 bacterium]